MTIPTIHLNGTSRSELERQLADAAGAIRAAMAALGNAAPNGRDYYPQGPTVITQALTEHESRMARLRSVVAELETMYDTLAEGR